MTSKKTAQQISFLIGLFFVCSSASAEWFSYKQAIMGTPILVEMFAENTQQAKQCSDRVFEEMHRIDNLMSPYIEKSELALVNRNAAREAVNIGRELFELIQQSIKFSQLSNGAFDITFASVGHLYDYRMKLHPTDKQIKKQLKAINYKNIKLDETQTSISFSHKNTKIDLGGIAKGYAVDNGIKILQTCGIQNALVSAGGDSRIMGDKKGRPWVMGIRHPRDKNKVVVSIPLSDSAISTSGDYERYFIEDETRYHHIIKPTTGQSAEKTWSVSVLASDAVTSDALSTTLFVMGTEKALELINTLDDIEAIVIDSKGKMFYSSGLMPPEMH
ncbi:MAG: thiamine biosynthesis protein ApbE [endosymbiont of Galathealinum brachiosum]|uniref:FAD:protein FMN transferase n=1 Tax=endosymbiont of Galathealinum brachiosum TaxID=2200906 RepID=A0A370DDX3_9GAMM|nr:MAG: thiamine biosynthesis protein ApbE [endosymbiont of Galathealinum brachiosum]